MDSSVSPKDENLVSARVPSHFKRSLTGFISEMQTVAEMVLVFIVSI